MRHKGLLKKWQDDRGFGFIKPEKGGKDVFLHISALKRAARRPQVGDTIIYQLTMKSDGRVCAINAAIVGVEAPQRTTTPKTKRKFKKSQKKSSIIPKVFAGLAIAVAGTLIAYIAVVEVKEELAFRAHLREMEQRKLPPRTLSIPGQSNPSQSTCKIKGNISISSGRKLYHVPGMQDYNRTRIEPVHGERWFCSEAEARASGWTRAPR